MATRVFDTAQQLRPYHNLAAAIMTQAIRDCVYGDLFRRLDALLWLAGPDAEELCYLAGWNFKPSLFLTDGSRRLALLRLKGGKDE